MGKERQEAAALRHVHGHRGRESDSEPLERRHGAIGNNGLEIVRHAGKRIEADRPLGIGRIDIDEIFWCARGNVREHRFGQIAMRIEQVKALAGNQVLPDQVEKQRAFPGAGLADEIEMSTASFLPRLT